MDPALSRAVSPLLFGRKLLFPKHAEVADITERRVVRRTVNGKRTVCLLSVDQDDQILSFRRKPHRLGLVNPPSQLSDLDGRARLCRLSVEMILPVMSQDEVGRVEGHLPELEWVGDTPHERPEGLVYGESTVL